MKLLFIYHNDTATAIHNVKSITESTDAKKLVVETHFAAAKRNSKPFIHPKKDIKRVEIML